MPLVIRVILWIAIIHLQVGPSLGRVTCDFDGDGDVTYADLLLLSEAMGGHDRRYDLNRDGYVDAGDAEVFKEAFALPRLAAGLAVTGQADLELRQPNVLAGNTVAAQVGDIIDIEVFIRGRGEQITGVQLFFSFDDTYLELVPQGPSERGPVPFVPGNYMVGTVLRNDSMDDQIGDSNLNGIPLYQMAYEEHTVGFGDTVVARVGDGVIARFSVRLIRQPADGRTNVHVDLSGLDGQDTGYFTASDPGNAYSFRTITPLTVQLSLGIPDVYLLPGTVDSSLDLDDFLDDPNSPDSTIIWTNSLPDPAGASVAIDPFTHVVTIAPGSFRGVTQVIFTATTTLRDTLRDTIDISVPSIGEFDESAIPDTIRFVEGGFSTLVLVSSGPIAGSWLIFASPDTTANTIASIANPVATLFPYSGLVTLTAAPNFTGEELRTFTVSDPFGLADTTQVLVIVDPFSQHRAGVTVTVIRPDGRPAANAEVAFSRSVSGRPPLGTWSGTTDVDGRVRVLIESDPSGQFRRTGVGGYYQAAATLPDGETVRWNSIPIDPGEHALVLPVRGRARPRLLPDRNLEAAVRVAAGRLVGPLFLSELADLTFLSASSRGIRDLTGLSSLRSLTFLHLWNNQIEDVGPLSELTQLEELYLNQNQIKDISPLSSLLNLDVLFLWDNQISDVTPLENMIGLTELVIGLNPISDISPISNLIALTELRISQCQIIDISPLSGLTNLELLFLWDNQISHISPLSGLTALTELYINDNQIIDISPLLANEGLGFGDTVALWSNPLTEEAITSLIPELEGRGVTVSQQFVERPSK